MAAGSPCLVCGSPLRWSGDVQAWICDRCQAAGDLEPSASMTMPDARVPYVPVPLGAPRPRPSSRSPWARPAGDESIASGAPPPARAPQPPTRITPVAVAAGSLSWAESGHVAPVIEEDDASASISGSTSVEALERELAMSVSEEKIDLDAQPRRTMLGMPATTGADLPSSSSSSSSPPLLPSRRGATIPPPVLPATNAVAASALPRRSRTTTQSPFLRASSTTSSFPVVAPPASEPPPREPPPRDPPPATGQALSDRLAAAGAAALPEPAARLPTTPSTYVGARPGAHPGAHPRPPAATIRPGSDHDVTLPVPRFDPPSERGVTAPPSSERPAPRGSDYDPTLPAPRFDPPSERGAAEGASAHSPYAPPVERARSQSGRYEPPMTATYAQPSSSLSWKPSDVEDADSAYAPSAASSSSRYAPLASGGEAASPAVAPHVPPSRADAASSSRYAPPASASQRDAEAAASRYVPPARVPASDAGVSSPYAPATSAPQPVAPGASGATADTRVPDAATLHAGILAAPAPLDEAARYTPGGDHLIAPAPLDEAARYAPGANTAALAPYSPFVGTGPAVPRYVPPPRTSIPARVWWLAGGTLAGLVLVVVVVVVVRALLGGGDGSGGMARDPLIARAVAALAAADIDQLEALSMPSDLRVNDCTSQDQEATRSRTRSSHRESIRRLRRYMTRKHLDEVTIAVVEIEADRDPSHYLVGSPAMGARGEECAYTRDLTVHRLRVDVRVNGGIEDQMRIAVVELDGTWYLADFLLGGDIMDDRAADRF